MGSHDAFEELAAGHALHALEPEDEQALLAHLPGCPACQQTLAEMRAVAAQLAGAVADEAPPPELLVRIRAATGGTAKVATTFHRPRSRRLLRIEVPLARMVAAAAVIVVLAAGGVLLKLHGDAARQSATLNSYAAVIARLDDPSAQLISLGATGAARGAALVDGRRVYLVVANLGLNDVKTSIYVLWAQQPDGQMTAVTGFDVTQDGVTVVPAVLPADVVHPVGFAVSHENGRTIPKTPSATVLGPGPTRAS